MRFFGLLFLLSATWTYASDAKLERPDGNVLTHEFAQKRAAQIKSVNYKLFFHFVKDAEGFEGTTEILVDLNRLDEPLWLDASLSRVISVVVNGKEIKDFVVTKGGLKIPARYLYPSNRVEVRYFSKYNDRGQGLIRYKDKEDGREYLYSDSEPYGAHQFFPSFDQPDLKAKYTVTITAPKDWTAIQNAPIDSVKISGEEKTTYFQETMPFSTYLVFVGAGNYHAWTSSFANTPLTIYARESLAKYVDADAMFEITKKGLEFYNQYFEYPFPFKKYDHIFCPDLGPGAMENPGAVTMSERMIFRGQSPKSAYQGRANTILHEMAHMWFGDLVTMRWWNDLWLNESFATFMSSVAQETALGLGEEAWQDFTGTKGWAYWQDSLNTTHPIETVVPDTDAAGSNFDGITYGKGAAVLKQLRFYVGPENFRKGVANYFKKYAWQNTERMQFTSEIANAAGIDLTEWSRGWLESAGLNRVHANWSCAGDKLASLTLEQEPTKSGVFLPHKTQIGFYQKSANGIELESTLGVSYSGQRTEIAASDRPCPDFVYANYDDQDYAVFSLDQKSLTVAKELLDGFKSPLLRQMLWQNFHGMVMDVQFKLSDFLRLIGTKLPLEKNTGVVSSQIGRYSSSRELFWSGALSTEERSELSSALENSAWSVVANEKMDWNDRILWLDHYIQIARSSSAEQNLLSLLNTTWLDQDRRWGVIVELARLGYAGAEALISQELKRDTSSWGETRAYTARVSIPDLLKKKMYWTQLTGSNSGVSFGLKRAAAGAFHHADHSEIAEQFVDPFFQVVATFDWSGQMFMAKALFNDLFPSVLCSQELLQKSLLNFEKNSALPISVKRAWSEVNFELNRCINMKRFNRE